MKKGNLSFSAVHKVMDSPAFSYCTAFLLCGLLAGSFTGMHIPQQDDSYMKELAELLAGDSQLLSLRQTVSCGISVVSWYAMALIAGYGRVRELWIALINALRGFLMAFSVAASVIGCGLSGCVISLFTTGISAMFSVPALLLISAAALTAGRQSSRGYVSALKRFGGVIVFTALLTILAVLWRIGMPVLFEKFPDFISKFF